MPGTTDVGPGVIVLTVVSSTVVDPTVVGPTIIDICCDVFIYADVVFIVCVSIVSLAVVGVFIEVIVCVMLTVACLSVVPSLIVVLPVFVFSVVSLTVAVLYLVVGPTVVGPVVMRLIEKSDVVNIRVGISYVVGISSLCDVEGSSVLKFFLTFDYFRNDDL